MPSLGLAAAAPHWQTLDNPLPCRYVYNSSGTHSRVFFLFWISYAKERSDMRVEQTSQGFALYKEKSQIGWVHASASPKAGTSAVYGWTPPGGAGATAPTWSKRSCACGAALTPAGPRCSPHRRPLRLPKPPSGQNSALLPRAGGWCAAASQTCPPCSWRSSS